MTIKIGINGMGRIGRMIVRSIFETQNKRLEIRHINNRSSAEATCRLIKYDSMHGKFDADLNYDEKVDIYDLMLLVDFNLGFEGQVNTYFADINGDGMVNVMDLIALIRSIMGYGE